MVCCNTISRPLFLRVLNLSFNELKYLTQFLACYIFKEQGPSREIKQNNIVFSKRRELGALYNNHLFKSLERLNTNETLTIICIVIYVIKPSHSTQACRNMHVFMTRKNPTDVSTLAVIRLSLR